MNFLYDIPNNCNYVAPSEEDINSGKVKVKTFPSQEEAKKYCNRKDFCNFIQNEDESVNAKTIEEFEDNVIQCVEGQNNTMIMKKNKDYIISSKDKQYRSPYSVLDKYGELNLEMINDMDQLSITEYNNIQLIAEKDSTCILVLYKCPDENARSALNFSQSNLEKIIFLKTPNVDISSLKLSGLYIARLIFYINPYSSLNNLDFLTIIPNSQLVLYINNKVVYKKNSLTDPIAQFNVKTSETTEDVSIYIDFSFDTDSLTYKIDEEEIKISLMPLFNIGGSFKTLPSMDLELPLSESNYELLSKENPLLFSTSFNLEETMALSSCNISNLLSMPICKKILNESSNDKLQSKLLTEFRQNIEENNSDIVELIIHLYETPENSFELDYDTTKQLKDIIDNYFVNKFLNLSWSKEDLVIFKTLLPLLSKYHFSTILRTDFIRECSTAYAKTNLKSDGFCDYVENDTFLLNNEITKRDIILMKERRDFDFCSVLNKEDNLYNFEYKENKERCAQFFSENDAETPNSAQYLIHKKCSQNGPDNDEWSGLDSCKGLSERGDAIISKDRENYFKKIFMSKDNILKFSRGEEIENLTDFLNYTSNVPNNNLEFSDIFTTELQEVCEDIKNTESDKTCDSVYNYLITNSKKKEETENAEAVVISKRKKEANLCGANVLEPQEFDKYCKNIFIQHDSLNTILYSDHVYKYCDKNPFNSNCKEYYDKILDSINTIKSSSFENNIYPNNTNYTIFLIIFLLLIIVYVLRNQISTVFKDLGLNNLFNLKYENKTK
jgi:hypothetical protein